MFLRRQLPRLVMHSRAATRNPPGIRMIHHAPDSRAFSDRESILPQVTTARRRAE